MPLPRRRLCEEAPGTLISEIRLVEPAVSRNSAALGANTTSSPSGTPTAPASLTVVGFVRSVFGDVRMTHDLPLDSLCYDAGPYLPPDKSAALVAPYFEHLPTETRDALSLLPHYKAALSRTAGSSNEPIPV